MSSAGLTDFNPQGAEIDSIEIENRNIYDTDSAAYSGFLFRTANRLHMVTRPAIIRQELLFEVGQKFSQKIADETARNLRTRFPLNDAWIEVEPTSVGKVLVRVVTVDQWSLVGGLRTLRRDGNETFLRIGFEERNLLGRAQLISFDYHYQEADDNYISTSFRESRMFGRPFSLRLNYSDNPKSEIRRISLGRPYYNRDQRWAYGVAVSDGGGRVERFSGGDIIAKWHNKRDQAELTAAYRWGSYYSKTRLSARYRYLSQRTDNGTIADSGMFAPSDFPVDSTYHLLSAKIGFASYRYIVVKRINGFQYNEDITLGASIDANFGRAFDPDFKDHRFDVIGAEGRLSGVYGDNILVFDYSRVFWFKKSRDIRRFSRVGLRFYNNRLSFLTIAMRTFYLADKSDDVNPVNLGGRNGLRGFDTEYTSGDRMHVINLEGRLFPGLEILSAGVGAVVFADLGRTWRKGESVKFGQYFSSVGLGLRISLEKLSRRELIRIDAALSQNNQWELSIGTGQYF